MSDARAHWPAAERNREPILAVLRRVLPAQGDVLEIASGSGQHAAYFSPALPALRWQPSEADEALHASIRAWATEGGQVLPVLRLDVTEEPWPVGCYDAIFNANMIHIAPFEVCDALLRGAAAHLNPGAPLVLYGPFKLDGRHTAESNAAFDARLRGEDARWGVRDLEVVQELAAKYGLGFEERVEMPANNQTLVFVRAGVPVA
jgi:hypothetical protein